MQNQDLSLKPTAGIDPTPSWAPLVDIVLLAPLAKSTKARYRLKLNTFLRWWDTTGRRPFGPELVLEYVGALRDEKFPAYDIGHSLMAIKKLARVAAMRRLIDAIALDAIMQIKGPKIHPIRMTQWLSEDEVLAIMKTPDRGTLIGKRDFVLLALLLYTGLRCDEAGLVRFEHIRIVDGRPALVNLIGKGDKPRSVPMPGFLFEAIQAWVDASGITDGFVLRQLRGWNPKVESGDRMGRTAIWHRVKAAAKAIGKADLTPHDLRRTFGRIARKHGVELDQIQQSYGHSSVVTTQQYVGGNQDFENAPCDALPTPG